MSDEKKVEGEVAYDITMVPPEKMLETLLGSLTGAILDDVLETLRAVRVRQYAAALKDLHDANETELADVITREITDALEPPEDDEAPAEA